MFAKNENVISILVSDDHESLSEQVINLGISNDINILSIVDKGRKAVEAYFRLNPDIVLLNFESKEIDGIQTTEVIRKGDPQARVIIMTELANPIVMARSLEVGARGLCLKSTSTNRIRNGIDFVMRGEVWIDENVLQPLIQEALQESSASDINYVQNAEGEKAYLSSREIDVLHLVAKGYSNKMIGEELFISVETVKSHIRRIKERLSAADRTEAAVKAVRAKLL